MYKKLFVFFFLLNVYSCAFTPHIDKRTYSSKTKAASLVDGTGIDLFVNGEDSKVVGHIRNGFGAETANIEVPQTKRELIKQSLEQEFSLNGYKVISGAPLKVIIRPKQVELELAQESGKAGYFAICDLKVYLMHQDKLLERNFVSNDQIDSYWAVTASEGIDTFYSSINKCSAEIVSEVTKRVKQ